jgi:hypothetical protein
MVDFITPIVIVIILVALVAIVNAWVIGSADKSFFELMVKMPKFVDKPDATLADYEAPPPSSSSHAPSEKPGMIETYHNLRLIAIFVMAGAFILGMILFLGEEFGIQKKGQAIELVANALIYSLFLMVFPVLWDSVATGVEYLNVYILNPANPTPENAAARAKDLFIKLGGINTEFDMGKLLEGTAKALVGDQSGLTQLFHDVMTAIFRAFLAALIFMMMFIIGTIRIVLTASIIVGLPMILAIKLVPGVRRPADRLLETLYGLVVATVLSSIVVVAGAAYLDTLPKDSVVENFQAFVAAAAVIILAIFMPVMLSPMLGSVVSSITGMVTSSLMAGVVAGGSATMGAAKGAAGALGYGGAATASLSDMGMGGDSGGAFGGGVATAGLGSRLAQNAMQGIGGANNIGMGSRSTQQQDLAPEIVAAKEERAMRYLPPSGRAPVTVSSPATGSAPSIKSEPPLAGTSKPVVETPSSYRADISTIEDAAAVIKTSAKDSSRMPAFAIQPGSVVFAPDPTPLSTAQKLHMGAKGTIIGGMSGLAQGLGKGLAMESRSAGMADIGKAISSAIGGRFDFDKDGNYFEFDDMKKGVEKLRELATKQVKTVSETYVSEAGERGVEGVRESFMRADEN